MELKNYFAQDTAGNIIPGASVYVYKAGTTTTVPIFNAAGNPKDNPFVSDGNGQVQFMVANGLYDLRIVGDGRDSTIRIQALDVQETVSAVSQSAEEARISASNAATSANAAGSHATSASNAQKAAEQAAGQANNAAGSIGDSVAQAQAAALAAQTSADSVGSVVASASQQADRSKSEADRSAASAQQAKAVLDQLNAGGGVGSGGGTTIVTGESIEQRTNLLTKNLFGRQAVATLSAPHTTHMIMELESDFMAIRVGLHNLHTAAVSGVKVCVALHNRADAPAWLIENPPAGNWIDLTQGGSTSFTLQPRLGEERPSLNFSDFIALRSMPRADGGKRPLLMIRIEYPSGAVQSKPANGISNWRATDAPRYFKAARQDVLGVTDKAAYTNTTNTEAGCTVPAVQYITRKTGRQLLITGDSTMEGIGSTPACFGASQIVAYGHSTPEEPFEYYNAALHAQPPMIYHERVNDLIDVVTPTHITYTPWSGNDVAKDTGITDQALDRLYLSLAKVIRRVREAKVPAVLILTEGLPANTAYRPVGANDAKRIATNLWINGITGVRVAKGYAAAMSGTTDSTGQVQQKPEFAGDGAHPNRAGYNALAATIEPTIFPAETEKPSNPGTPTNPTNPVVTGLPLAGMNIAGLGNNPWRNYSGAPQTSAPTDFRVVEEATLINFVKDLGGRPWLARIDIAGERLIRFQGDSLNANYVADITKSMDLIHKYGGKVILDLHNYWRWWQRNDTPPAGRKKQVFNGINVVWYVIGEPDCIINKDGVVNLWMKIAQQFMTHPALFGYGLMNEPHNNDVADPGLDVNAMWRGAVQGIIDGVRAFDTEHWIMVAGCQYSNAKLWETLNPGLENLTDKKADRLIYEAHQYQDDQGSGGGKWVNPTQTVDPQQGVKDFTPFIDWLKKHNKRGYVGEFGGPASAPGFIENVENLMNLLNQNRIPYTQWRAGPGFADNYPNGLNLADGTLKPNATPLMKNLGKTVESYGPRT